MLADGQRRAGSHTISDEVLWHKVSGFVARMDSGKQERSLVPAAPSRGGGMGPVILCLALIPALN